MIFVGCYRVSKKGEAASSYIIEKVVFFMNKNLKNRRLIFTTTDVFFLRTPHLGKPQYVDNTIALLIIDGVVLLRHFNFLLCLVVQWKTSPS